MNEQQRIELREILHANREHRQELDRKIREARRELDEATFADEFNEKTIQKKAESIAALEAERITLRAKAFAKLRPSLTPEQIERIKRTLKEAGLNSAATNASVNPILLIAGVAQGLPWRRMSRASENGLSHHQNQNLKIAIGRVVKFLRHPALEPEIKLDSKPVHAAPLAFGFCRGGGPAHTAFMEPADADLIAAVLKGDTASFERLIEKYSPRVFATARRYARRESEVEDIVQEGWSKGYQKLASFRAEGRMLTQSLFVPSSANT